MIPSTIVTTEALAVWLAELHHYLYPNLVFIEGTDENDDPYKRRCVEANSFYFVDGETPEWRHCSAQAIKLKPEFKISGKPWNKVEVLGDKDVPLEMRA